MEKQNESAGFPWVKLAVTGVAGYALWRNRFKIQELLTQAGISTPLFNNNISDTVKSGAAKVAGGIKKETSGSPNLHM